MKCCFLCTTTTQYSSQKLLTKSSSPFFTTHKTVTLQTPEKPSISLTRCSAAQTRNQNVPKSAIERIADKLRSLGIVEQTSTQKSPNLEPEEARENDSAGEIFIPLPEKIPKYRVGHTIDSSWSTPENPVPKPGSGAAIVGYSESRKEVGKQKWFEKKNSRENQNEKEVPTLAELKLSTKELSRLRTIRIGLKKELKVGKAGITEGIVNGIHERWRNFEVVKIVCEDLCRLNMKRTRDLLERKTGCLVVWRAGSKIILYRGEIIIIHTSWLMRVQQMMLLLMIYLIDLWMVKELMKQKVALLARNVQNLLDQVQQTKELNQP